MTADGIAITLLPAVDGHDPHVAGELAGLVNDVYRAAEEGIWRDGFTRTTAAEVAELIAAGQVAVAVRDGRLVGVVRVSDVAGGAGEFGMLAASPEHRGTGVGRALVEFAERRARDRGLPAMRLELFVPRERRNPTKEFLRAWYGRLGYELVATVPVQDAYPDLAPQLATPCDVQRYEKPLAGSARDRAADYRRDGPAMRHDPADVLRVEGEQQWEQTAWRGPGSAGGP